MVQIIDVKKLIDEYHKSYHAWRMQGVYSTHFYLEQTLAGLNMSIEQTKEPIKVICITPRCSSVEEQ